MLPKSGSGAVVNSNSIKSASVCGVLFTNEEEGHRAKGEAHGFCKDK